MTVARYLKEVRNATLLSVHGESLGGAVACYIASHIDVQFLFCDRTFCSLYEVAGVSFGVVARSVLKAFTGWDLAPINDYLDAGCYKALSCDPADTIIKNLSSLKSGISHRFASKIELLDTGTFASSLLTLCK